MAASSLDEVASSVVCAGYAAAASPNTSRVFSLVRRAANTPTSVCSAFLILADSVWLKRAKSGSREA